MTTMQINAMNAQIWRNMSVIAEREPLMKRLSRYLNRLVKEREDATLMNKEEFFAKIERAEQQAKRGEGMELLPGEDLATFLKRNGYEI